MLSKCFDCGDECFNLGRAGSPYRLDVPGKPWFDVLAQICRNSDKTLKTEYLKKFKKKDLLTFYGPSGRSKVNKSQILKMGMFSW